MAALVANVGTEGRHEHEGSTRRRGIAESLAELRLYNAGSRSSAVGSGSGRSAAGRAAACASHIVRSGAEPAARGYRPSAPRDCRSAAPMRRPAS